jgi:hypothetical protein
MNAVACKMKYPPVIVAGNVTKRKQQHIIRCMSDIDRSTCDAQPANPISEIGMSLGRQRNHSINSTAKDRHSAPPNIPLAAVTRAASPAGPCDVRGVMLHLGPGASRKRVPPSPDVPSGNNLGCITNEVTSALRPVSSRTSRMLDS